MSKQVLEGVKILDCSAVIAGPTGGAMLAEFGADVIRVEGDGGKATRNFKVMNHVLNRNKRCINLNFHHPEAIDIFYQLVDWADVVIMNFRPQALKKWKIDYEDVIKRKPDIIYMHFTAYGRKGPYKDRPGFARVLESFVGLPAITGDPDPDGHPQLAGSWIVDGMSGLGIAYSIMLALFHKQRTGEGQLIDLALYDVLLRILEETTINYSTTGTIKKRMGNAQLYSVPNNVYKTKDDQWVVMPCNGEAQFKRLCQAMDRMDLLEDERFNSMEARVKNRKLVDGVVSDWYMTKTREEALEALQKYEVASGPINTVKDVCEDPHLWERGSLIKVFYEDMGKEAIEPGVVPILSKTPGQVKWAGPAYGADNDDVYLNLLNMPKEQYEAFKASGVIS